MGLQNKLLQPEGLQTWFILTVPIVFVGNIVHSPVIELLHQNQMK